MARLVRRFAFGLGVAALIGLAGGSEFANWFDSDDTDITGALGRSADAQLLPLTLEERAQIFDGVMRINSAPVADVAPPEPMQALPFSVALQEMPAGVARLIPLVEGYKFVKLDDRILLVNPKSRVVVAWMPRYKLVLN